MENKKIYTITYCSFIEEMFCDTDVVETIEDVHDIVQNHIADINEEHVDEKIPTEFNYNGGKCVLKAEDSWNGRFWYVKIQEHIV